MSATDPRFSEHVADYVAGRLVGESLERFELALFADAELLAAVESESALRSGFRQLAVESRPDVSALPVRQPRARPPVWLALAASFAFGALLSGFLPWPSRNTPGNEIGYANVQVALLEAIRGAAARPLLTLSSAAPRIVLQFPVVNSAETTSYSIALHGAGLFARQFDGLLPDRDGLLSLELPTAGLAPGDYEAQISSIATDNSRHEYQRLAFELRR